MASTWNHKQPDLPVHPPTIPFITRDPETSNSRCCWRSVWNLEGVRPWGQSWGENLDHGLPNYPWLGGGFKYFLFWMILDGWRSSRTRSGSTHWLFAWSVQTWCIAAGSQVFDEIGGGWISALVWTWSRRPMERAGIASSRAMVPWPPSRHSRQVVERQVVGCKTDQPCSWCFYAAFIQVRGEVCSPPILCRSFEATKKFHETMVHSHIALEEPMHS